MSLENTIAPYEIIGAERPRSIEVSWKSRRHAPLVIWLSKHGFHDADSVGVNGVTPLMEAALEGNDHIVATLLYEGVPVGMLDDEENSALWYACLNGSPKTVLRLIEAGLEIDHTNGDDLTCLMQAASSGRLDVMRFLMSLGANERLVAPDGRNALEMMTDCVMRNGIDHRTKAIPLDTNFL
ncbi:MULTISPECIES: ankyrin repeat domain-containing protein [Cupriavidus]|uniref:Ankyrin n=2 Tax=Cupriavidus TaxID=106589 RepID=A0A375DC66_9BURK|nr:MULTISPECIES: ankyrin repeat domain-containing protein [Cupriavidus]MCO4865956.1 ankyrin repeat domain-containing protein [Cupriavidus sp. WGlv3]MCO4893617.1 ankyrin repeat domain-containing protein [Cupriavidus sp. WGtm5]SOY77302.1 Ankyrin [Cupriavidus taiwanensis]SOY78289.1 Ankyrin [Cupriavidus taiwanensis]SOY78386.1 Ankyrin [Cupriavidus taiwanensis]